MSRANDREIVKKQYSTENNLSTRQNLHKIYSTNHYSWQNWIYDQYELNSNHVVVEFGCGNGSIWKENIERIPQNIKISLSDISQGMILSAKENLNEIGQVCNYEVDDIQNSRFASNHADCVIANHMLYHVSDRKIAIGEVARILKSNGTFYASTNGLDHLREMKEILSDFDSRLDAKTFSVAHEFGLENGQAQLREYFDSVEVRYYEDSLQITDAQPLIDYMLSMKGHLNIDEVMTNERINELYELLNDRILNEGYIKITKNSGVFVAKGPKKQ
ncbi:MULTISPECIES: class I SAM-dependent methyltransferase [unclassified Fusibacter]|uniref:class I SAM-dependent methyltransferase n=1 Tax=unclassified Fusibacter TaxID=2624464 RepID=UPI00101213AC|nr:MULTISPECIES: class I SAM-dependent methyltransferase [unclassified Fusibacter]MCK8058941.1 class I SAM-dependent methyltransferase [Fusibacter sp. A2]NPE22017.1 class I SAM-dependent methyltransferase [Fusibacter sp. A1]RXV61582.1 class I SAM-dependent methyltransferase [Fusibacter sp. A1]